MRSRRDLLSIYLNDQLAAGVAWRELARRAAASERGTPAGTAAGQVADAIAEDVRTFERMMERLGVPRSPVKPTLAIAAERVGRLKPNGRLRARSPLSRFVELDVLAMGIEGKKILWRTLRDQAGLATRVPEVDFDALIVRADEQLALIEPHRRAAAATALGG
jgi:hypothetical protein